MGDLHTFSIVARDAATGAFGVAVATARPAVGALVPWVSLRGAIATQARVNTDFGRDGLVLLERGTAIDAALEKLLVDDPDRDIRQVHGIDASESFRHTGERCVPWCGHHAGDGYTIAGNMLTGPEVLAAMAAAYDDACRARRELGDRLLAALEAGQAAGGDKRGKQSAALLVASPDVTGNRNLRVDDHAEPVQELRRIYGVVIEHARRLEKEYGADAGRLFNRIKL